jgi:hypothetical protein
MSTRRTSKKIAKVASELLKAKRTSYKAKQTAGSALSQRSKK